MFRGKESSNRIELSSIGPRHIEFWCFGHPAALGVGVWVYGGGGVIGGCPHTCAHACTHTHMHMHTHTCGVVNMIISCKWPPPLGESLGIPYDVISACMFVHMHACACVCMCVGVTLSPTPPTSSHPPTPQGGHPLNQSKFNST